MRGTRSATLSTTGMIATPHYLASSAGLKMLDAGGSAMDAVIAANAVLTVVYPDQTAIGGDCFFLVYDAGSNTVEAFNGSGSAAGNASAAELLDNGYERMPAKGPLTITVPGTIDAWSQGHERYGTLDWDGLFEAAIGHAEDGFPVSPRLGRAMANNEGLIRDWPGLAELLLPAGVVPAAGSSLSMPNLAESLRQIANEGAEAFYSGTIAGTISAAVAAAGGGIDAADLARYRGEWVNPIEREYQGIRVLTVPPNSQGLTVLMELGMIGLEDAPGRWGELSGVYYQVEAASRAYRERNLHVGDPEVVEVDTRRMLSNAYLRDLWSDLDRTGSIASPGRADGDTVYLCAVDRAGNAFSMIQSLFGAFGSCVVGGDTGIILQNRGSAFSLDPDSPNVLQPGKRPLHSLMPSMLMAGGELLGPIGTQGGNPQAQIQLQLITNVLDFGMDPQEAIDAPRWIASDAGVTRSLTLLMESGFPAETIAGLGRRGHNVTVIDPWNPDAGHAQMILRDVERGVLVGGADPRADGVVLGQ